MEEIKRLRRLQARLQSTPGDSSEEDRLVSELETINEKIRTSRQAQQEAYSVHREIIEDRKQRTEGLQDLRNELNEVRGKRRNLQKEQTRISDEFLVKQFQYEQYQRLMRSGRN
mmetsp:Transcript_34679/g.73565  ORF Transcript_34679/g.73565 Transcript_34679/m.73565 type:complete len:114 (+) Transcript_34679:1-342(+)